MSMVTETFYVMNADRSADGMGGTLTVWMPGEAFCGAVAVIGYGMMRCAGRRAVQERIGLYHERDMVLQPGDRVQRARDGSVFRVTGRSEAVPEGSGLRLAKVDAERLVSGL